MKREQLAVFRRIHSVVFGVGLTFLLVGGCHSADRDGAAGTPKAPPRGRPSNVRGVRCVFDQKPWLNADAAGDRDPEGISYRVFLDTGSGKGVLCDGTFYVQMYEIRRVPSGEVERTLVSDWRYPTKQFSTISAKILGKGYHMQLRWAKKDIAGHEVEIITQFIDGAGNATRSGTKRLRVPKYLP